jgi:phosphatidylglycerol lysyltransferase
VGLLLVSNALWRRLDAGFYLAASGLGAGIVVSLAKGGDYEEALLLALVLAALLRGRRRFSRRAAFFATRVAPEWIAAVLAVVLASVWLGLFAFKHVGYSSDLWWRFELNREASRFLRASVGTAMALLVFGVARLLRAAPPEVALPGDDDLARAGRILETQTATAPFLVFLRDKAVLFSPQGDAFLMYAVQGKTWVAMGDPVGPAAATPALIREFLERCREYDGEPVFYEVRKDRLYQYADFGLTFVKLGEEATVPLESFNLDGARAKGFRRAINRLPREGCAFRVIEQGEVAAVLPQLQEVSDEWLSHRNAAEKGFSLGFFDPGYVRRFPVAVVERGARIEAFANLWPGPQRAELSVDLMRYRANAPVDVMEALLASLMVWGKAQGYGSFSLGMAPLSGIESSPAAALWMRLARFLYQHGEALYKFQGLRAYKEKFHPVWEPRYLAYAGGLQLARILADVAALIAGGYRRIFLK